MATVLIMLAIFWLAYSNGANDNFKGVATLYGSGTTSFKKSLLWATATTVAGSIISVLIAGKLVAVFSGKGLVPASLLGTPQLLIAVGGAGAITILLATRLGLPTSTTHALTGGLVGVALVSSSGGINWGTLLNSFAAPLILSPLLAVALSAIVYPILRRVAPAASADTCVCVDNEAPALVNIQKDSTANLGLAVVSPVPSIYVDQTERCVEQGKNQVLTISGPKVIDCIHYLSSGTVCLSRALNDTPKIAALLIAANIVGSNWSFGLVVAAMAAGGLLNSRRVAETMSKKITELNPVQGLSANLVTSLLVLFASKFGAPVSTTHVSCGSIFGMGLVNGNCRWKMVAEIVSAWATTLPLAAILSGILFLLVQHKL
jgi:inorganic phosphate transporter, PiT family